MTTNERRAHGATQGWWAGLAAMALGALGCGEVPTTLSLVEDDAATRADARTFADASVVVPGPDAGTAEECRGCFVDGVCHRDGARRACEVCDPSRSTTSFVADDGASCDDGLFCTIGDVCTGGVCLGITRSCDDAVACTTAETCDEALDACSPGHSTCGPTLVCDATTGGCLSTCDGCTIEGVCHARGELHPSEPCAICDPDRATDAWSANDGARCDDGLFCTVTDRCASFVCEGGPRDCDDGIACTGTELCSEDEDRCLPGEPSCPAGSTCSTLLAACVWDCAGCAVDGVCMAEGDTSPGNPCGVCDPARDRFGLSPVDGVACDDGSACTDDVCIAGACHSVPRACNDGIACNGSEVCDPAVGVCVMGVPTCGAGELCDEARDVCEPTCDGCAIDGVCYADGWVEPTRPCLRCDASRSTTAWTADDGAGCDDGLACTVDVCRSGICEGTPVVCDDGVACNGAELCNETSGVCTAGSSTCAEGAWCDAASDVCVCDGCSIDGACFAPGTVRPGNPCEVCAAAGDTAWSALADGASCEDGIACTVDACVAGACVGVDTCPEGRVCEPEAGECELPAQG